MEALSAGFSLVDRYYQTPRTTHPDFFSAITRIAGEEKLEAIYVSSPSELKFFAANKEKLELELDLQVFVNPPEVVRIGNDKLETARFLSTAGFHSPATVLASEKQAVEQLVKQRGFPLIAKPRRGFSSRNVFLVNTLQEIEAASTLVPDLIIQQYLPDEANEFTAATLSGPDKKVRAQIILRRDLLQGTTYRTELVKDIKIEQEVVRIVEALGAVGPCNLQFRMVDRDLYVFEINPRFSGTSGIRYLYGFNDSEMIFELFRLGVEVQQPPLKQAVVLRYWNEVYISNASFEDLKEGSVKHDGVETVIKLKPNSDGL